MGTVLCFVPARFAEFEITLALHVLRDIGEKKIVTVGYTQEPVTSFNGLRCVADITLEEAAALPDVEAFLMPGGPICERNEALVSLIQKLDRQQALLAAICFGPQYLARAGVLNAHRFTTSCRPDHMKALGLPDPFPRAHFVEDRVVTDGNVITAQGEAFVDFAFAIAGALGLYAAHEEDLKWLYHTILNR